MRYIIHSIETPLVALFFRDDKDVAECGDVTVHIGVGRVDETLSVNRDAIGIKFGIQGLGGHAPYPILPLLHLQTAVANLLEVEGHASVGIDDRRSHSGPLTQLLLSEALHRHQATAN